MFIQTVHYLYITPFLCIIDIIDFKDGHATPKFWVLVNFTPLHSLDNFLAITVVISYLSLLLGNNTNMFQVCLFI